MSGDRGAWALIDRAQAGDVDAFGDLYALYHNHIRRFIQRRVAHRATAEDLAQDTFVKAYRSLNTVEWTGRDPVAWLLMIARNLVSDHFKSARIRTQAHYADAVEVAASRPDDAPDPETALVDYFDSLALLAAVRQLNPEQQECIVLRFLRGLSVAETARAMGKQEGAIKGLQYRATASLRRLLGVDDERRALLDERFGPLQEVQRERPPRRRAA